MSTFDQYPQSYLDNLTLQSKQMNILVSIEGLDYTFSLLPTYTKVRYGDPGVLYGDPGLVYGGLRLVGNNKDYLDPSANLVINQKIEPEQGKGSVSTLSITLIDFDQFVTNLVSPGFQIDEIMGNKLVKVFIGFAGTSYPEDYFRVFQGFISQTTYVGGKWTLQLSDPNIHRRQDIFQTDTTKTLTAIDAVQTSIPVISVGNFSQQILGPNALYDSNIHTYIKIDDEVMEYGPGGANTVTNTFTVTRGARGTTAATHDIGTDVNQTWEISGNVIDILLKIMLSGWNGPWTTGNSILSIGNTLDPFLGVQFNAIRLPHGVNADEEYNPIAGDYLTISGSSAGNDGTYLISSLGDAESYKNAIIYVNTNLNVEFPTTATFSIRSQYDVWPDNVGLRMKPTEIDLATIIEIRQFYLTTAENQMRFYMLQSIKGKDFIEGKLLLPLGAYSITRYGRCSMSITLPPIAGIKLPVVSKDTLIDPTNLQVTRTLNNRRFWNEIAYSYDQHDTGNYGQEVHFLDSDSLNRFGISMVLPIQADGLRTDLGASALISRRAQFLLTRYKNAAYEIICKVNWQVGSIIEVGDVIILNDSGYLQIPNLDTGERNLAISLLEVINRSMDLKSGQVTLNLLSSLGYSITDRFATISPSSVIAGTSTVNYLDLTPSFGAAFGADEHKKWDEFATYGVVVHDYNWTFEYTSTFSGFDPVLTNRMLLNTPLPATPPAGAIVDISRYSDTDTNPNDESLYKIAFAHLDPTLTVVSGLSQTQFTVSSGDAAQLNVGLPILIRNASWSQISNEVLVQSIVGTTITTNKLLGFTPSAGEKIELIGFKDLLGPYRWI